MNCKLCGLPAPSSPIVDDGLVFCCFGCREVYRCFGEAASSRPSLNAQEFSSVHQGQEAYLWIDGMHCSSCELLIQRMALKIPGVHEASASYATSTAKIVYDPERIRESELPASLSRAGYRARLRNEEAPLYDERKDLLRLFTAACLASVVMMLSFLFLYPIHSGFADPNDYRAIASLAFGAAPAAMFVLTTVVVFYPGLPILHGAWIALRAGMLNMDILLAVSVLSAYFYSIVQILRNPLDVYFDVASSIVAIVTVGRFLEKNARLHATGELDRILRTWPSKARVRKGEGYTFCAIGELEPESRVLVRQGEAIPLDGVILSGQGGIDESLMTGEAFPVAKVAGQKVLGGTVLVDGELEIMAGSVIESRIADLAKILWRVQGSTAGIQRTVDRFSRSFVPAVLALAAIVGIASHAAGASTEQALLASLSTLIVSCPCTFGLAIPLTVAAAISSALGRGIIFVTSDLFEKARRIDVVAIDKTGTLSGGGMRVIDVIGPPEIAARAAAVERHSAHPVAKAIAQLDRQKIASELETYSGKGVLGSVDGHRVATGSNTFFKDLGWEVPPLLAGEITTRGARGEVVSLVGWEGCAKGAIVIRDQPRPEWKQVLDRIRKNCRVVLLTGAEHMNGYDEHVDEAYSGIPPEAKAEVVRRLRKLGAVAMIGDGSNDALALAEADLGIAFGAPTALAAAAADIIIPGDRLERVLDTFGLLHSTQSRIRQNLGWALLYNVTAIPLAMTGFLNPLFAALAMSASSILVVLNAARPISVKCEKT